MSQDATIHYYNQKAEDYIRRTFHHDMGEDQRLFTQHLSPREKILDAGCGSGRDALAFQKEGFDVLGIDASEEMVKHTQSLRVPAKLQKLEDSSWSQEFGGIWCSASLLHIPKEKLSDVIQKLHTAGKKGAIFFVSFKQGEGERFENGRYFHMMNEKSLLGYFHSFTLLEMWSRDSDVNLVPTTWLKAIFRKNSA